MRDYTKYIGQRWVYQKNDCIEVVREILRDEFAINVHEIPTPDISDFDQIKGIFRVEAASDQWIMRDNPSEGYIALFYNRRDEPMHIGLCIDDKSVIHCPGTPKNPGSTEISRLRDMPAALYARVEFYEYNAY